MKTLEEIKLEIEGASERRGELYNQLSHGHDAELAGELRELDAKIARLWDEQRAARVQARFGDRDGIIKRARLEERLDRAA